MTLGQAVMLRRMFAADASADGLFITGVTSTGIYCLPSCRARKPRPENVVFYDSPPAARAAGLRACLRCRPDDFYLGLDQDEARVSALLSVVDSAEMCAEVRNVAALAECAGVGLSKLHELFRVHLQTTPAEWLSRRRVRQAQALLLATGRPVTEIAFEVGFGSLSAFGQQFRRVSALTPQAYRRMPLAGRIEFTLPGDYPLAAVLHDLNRDHESLTARVEGQVYTAALNVGLESVVIQVDFKPGKAVCTPLNAVDVDWAALHATLLHVLGLSADPARFEALVQAQADLAPLLDGQRGLRIPLTPDPFDALVWALLGQQVTFSWACTLRRRLTERVSAEVADGLYAPPSAQAIAALTVEELQNIGLIRRRAATLLNAAQMVTDGRLRAAESGGTGDWHGHLR